MPKVKNKMSEEDRKNLELMYEDIRFVALIAFTVTFTCFVTAITILLLVQNILGLFGFFGLVLLGGIINWEYWHTVHWKRSIISKKLGTHKTAEKYGLVKRRKLRKE